MNEKKQTTLKQKAVDYKNFSMVLLSLSAFLTIGSITPFQDKTVLEQVVLMWTGVTLIIMSVVFFLRKRKIQEQIEDL